MISGTLRRIAGPADQLTYSTFSTWLGFDVLASSKIDHLLIARKNPSKPREGGWVDPIEAPIFRLPLTSDFLLSLIGNGRHHKVGENFQEGVRAEFAESGEVDLIGGIDAQRDGPDAHQIRLTKFTYGESDDRFSMLFDIVLGSPILGKASGNHHSDVNGHRFWLRFDPFWKQLYDFHDWATAGKGNDRPGEILRERLGIEVARSTMNAGVA